MTLDTSQLSYMFSVIESYDDMLTPWEVEFIESIQDQHSRGKTLTERQLEILERIWLKLP